MKPEPAPRLKGSDILISIRGAAVLFRLLSLTALGLAVYGGPVRTAQANVQFDVFLGYDGIVPEASWFPVVCEIKNDGPAFNGLVDLSNETYGKGQNRQVAVELPTGTLKRLTIPVFSGTRGYTTWDVRLLDDRGKVRGEQLGLQPRKQIASETPLVGSLPRTAGGTPLIEPVKPQASELQPGSARLQPSIFPDNPLVLEGMDTLYLNSEKASELRDTQVSAMLAWLNGGGHLIVGVEQLTDVNSSPWLRRLFPADLKNMKAVTSHPELQEWLKTASGMTNLTYVFQEQSMPGKRKATPTELLATNAFARLPDDFTFEAAEMQVATGSLRDGHVVVSAADTPLIITANRGRGRITGLLFSPEREPFRSWKNLPIFWAKMADVPGVLYVSSQYQQPGWSPSSDGIFGAMLDTNQVHKLPVEWLLLLLIVYLVVIGPLDQFWLKRINRPMLTWITFPCYVVLFSLLIYFIGYKLRAGESEWNELHLVDVLFNAERAELRGRTYASVYSPSNQKYNLASQQRFSTLRGEFLGGYTGGHSTEKTAVLQTGDNFKAEIFVPVWTSQLYVNDWWDSGPVPLTVTVTNQGQQWFVKVDNRTSQKLSNAQVAVDNHIMNLGDLPAKATKSFTVTKGQGTNLREFVTRHGHTFQNAVQSRKSAFGATDSGRIGDLANSTVAASFISQMTQPQSYMGSFISAPGLDLSPVVERGNAVLFAWASDYSPIKPLNQFTPRRSHRSTMWRVAVAVQ
jgi:hypothetical protein